MKFTKRADIQKQIEEISNEVLQAVRGLPGDPFGHGFLWGMIEVKQKNGKMKRVRSCIGSICVADPSEAIHRAEKILGLGNVWFNLD